MQIQEALEVVGRTHPGMVRAHNEDSVASSNACGLVILADGMGGHNAGEVASGMAVSIMLSKIKEAMTRHSPWDKDLLSGGPKAVALLREHIQNANSSIFQASEAEETYSGMGTTLVSGLFYDNQVAVAHVGDSRMYRLRCEVFESITSDHSWLQEQINQGVMSVVDAKKSRNKNLVTRAVGIGPEVESEINIHSVLPGDIYLLCSDGLNDMIPDEDIGDALKIFQSNLDLASDQLIQMANDNGGKDNVSVILVKVKGDFSAPNSWCQKLKTWLRF